MNKTILVVEDNRLQADITRRELERSGFDCHLSSSAIDAIDDIDDINPAAIVLDIGLPAVNGLALLHELRSHSDFNQIKVILMSNLASDLSEDVASDYGLSEVIDKSKVLPGDIIAAVKRATDGQ